MFQFNLVANEIIPEEWQPNVHLQAFADDFIFVISELTGAKLKATAQAALTKFQHWTDKHQLKVSTEKSTTILISRLNNINFNPNNYEDGTTSTKFHPAIFQLEDRISLKKQFFPVPGLNIFTDGSKIEDKTGSAFCVMEEDITKYEWMAQLRPFNTVFQAELLAIQEACHWASKTNQQIKVWSDSESSLHSIASIDTKSPIAQQTQEILLKSTNIKLGWIKAHVGYSGNEAADVLAKKATQEGIPTFIPAPRNHIKSLLQKEFIIRWQKEWDNGETGRSVHNVLPKVKKTPTPWQRPEICSSRATAHFQHISKDSTSEAAIPVAAESWETPYTMLQVACLQRHTT
ncbi:hypothetical protein AVEN_249011-1 [Araneus ventricosus]|uniref:RNase H type-1 domain-containing protein n=1 Tax=Araneus ventricosus TaxID=182803 RepID=A0A4Y2JYP8_ARAVE|nr:hypothetical protein AVEN_249011-1 [Araneus ventricosus]